MGLWSVRNNVLLEVPLQKAYMEDGLLQGRLCLETLNAVEH